MVPDVQFYQLGFGPLIVVFRADRTDDAAAGESADHINVAADRHNAFLAERSLPEGLVEIPDDQLDLVRDHGALFNRNQAATPAR